MQKAKEKLIYDNNRDSPEEKLADFFSGMDGIIMVMKRQENLKTILRAPIHSIFGGKSMDATGYFSKIIPPQRVLFFMISFFFNIYYSYESYYGYDIPGTGTETDQTQTDDVRTLMFPQFINLFWFWDQRSFAILVIAATHFGLGCSLFLRGILNSRAADHISDIIPGRNFFPAKSIERSIVSKVITLLQFPRTFLVLSSDNLLPLLLAVCSGIALFTGRIWFYAPCLVDVLLQIRYMSFIVTALSRNMITISLTILLVVLFLYFFAVVAHLFFPNQYDLSGHMNCDDIGELTIRQIIYYFVCVVYRNATLFI